MMTPAADPARVRSAVLGYPRIGLHRELKKITESFWKGEAAAEALLAEARRIRRSHWLVQKEAGIDLIASNDFSLYDHVLDTAVLVGAVPERYGWKGGTVGLDTYFSMARGIQEKQGVSSRSVPAMEMTKWFDTNYHYIVPELQRGQRFAAGWDKPVDEFREALALGVKTRPVLVGPVTFLLLAKCKGAAFSRWELLDGLTAVYAEALARLKQAGADAVQMDEPALVLDLDRDTRAAFKKAYDALARKASGLDITLATYFGALDDNLETAAALPVAGLHVDLVRAPNSLADVLRKIPASWTLSLGLVDGRNIWKTDLERALKLAEPALARGRGRTVVASSSSLLHVPLDLAEEKGLDPAIREWLAFARQKLDELAVLKEALNGGTPAAAEALKKNRDALASRRVSKRIHVMAVKDRVRKLTPADSRRKSPFEARRKEQRAKLKLPLFPTTTIGSFPQTAEVRNARARNRSGALGPQEYQEFLRAQIRDTVQKQNEIGIDVLVHGEFERNDMVEYFGEQLEGFVFTQNGWVQSYGTRCVKPPIIFGDVSRPRPMTLEWTGYAQTLTPKPVKGMLTGPITILQWSFVRDDQPRGDTARQIALAIRDEVLDLEKAGHAIIQIDEPAIREGLPLRKAEWAAYLAWAVQCFRIASAGVRDATQIHTHMCYSEFNDIIQAIADMDADVISIETSRSQMELLDAFARFRYPNEIGPGVYDIHSPRVPSEEEIAALLKKAMEVLPAENLWVNPDCGLKTRGWKETLPSLQNMVSAARRLRGSLKAAAR
jgi:5-methyltetrahydropteroyltriglutamate--homocysteine methyltransferase